MERCHHITHVSSKQTSIQNLFETVKSIESRVQNGLYEFPWLFKVRSSVTFIEDSDPEDRLRAAFCSMVREKDRMIPDHFIENYHSCVINDKVIGDPYHPDLAEFKYFKEKPLNFLVIGKPGLNSETIAYRLAEIWKTILISPSIAVQTVLPYILDYKSKTKLKEGLQQVSLDQILEAVNFMRTSAESKRQGYVLCGFPITSHASSRFDIEKQLEFIFKTTTRPNIIVYLSCPSTDVLILNKNGYYRNIHNNNIYFKQHIDDGEVVTSTENSTTQMLENNWGLLKEYENFKEEEKTKFFVVESNTNLNTGVLDNYVTNIFPILDRYLLQYDSQCVLKVDGRHTTVEIIQTIRDKLGMLCLIPLCDPTPVFDVVIDEGTKPDSLSFRSVLSSDSIKFERKSLEVEDGSDEKSLREDSDENSEIVVDKAKSSISGVGVVVLDQYKNLEKNAAFQLLKKDCRSHSGFNLVVSDYNNFCPVEMHRGYVCEGEIEFACKYAGKLYLLSSSTAVGKFLKDPARYALSPPLCTRKIAIIGPPMTGKSTVAYYLSGFFGIKVISMRRLIEKVYGVDMRKMEGNIFKQFVEKARRKQVREEERHRNSEEKRAEEISSWITEQIPVIVERLKYSSFISNQISVENRGEDVSKQPLNLPDVSLFKDFVNNLKNDIRNLTSFEVNFGGKFIELYKNPSPDFQGNYTITEADSSMSRLREYFESRGFDFFDDVIRCKEFLADPLKLAVYLPTNLRQPEEVHVIDYEDVFKSVVDSNGIHTPFGFMRMNVQHLADVLEDEILEIEAENVLEAGVESDLRMGGWILDSLPIDEGLWCEMLARFLLPDDLICKIVDEDYVEAVKNQFLRVEPFSRLRDCYDELIKSSINQLDSYEVSLDNVVSCSSNNKKKQSLSVNDDDTREDEQLDRFLVPKGSNTIFTAKSTICRNPFNNEDHEIGYLRANFWCDLSFLADYLEQSKKSTKSEKLSLFGNLHRNQSKESAESVRLSFTKSTISNQIVVIEDGANQKMCNSLNNKHYGRRLSTSSERVGKSLHANISKLLEDALGHVTTSDEYLHWINQKGVTLTKEMILIEENFNKSNSDLSSSVVSEDDQLNENDLGSSLTSGKASLNSDSSCLQFLNNCINNDMSMIALHSMVISELNIYKNSLDNWLLEPFDVSSEFLFKFKTLLPDHLKYGQKVLEENSRTKSELQFYRKIVTDKLNLINAIEALMKQDDRFDKVVDYLRNYSIQDRDKSSEKCFSKTLMVPKRDKEVTNLPNVTDSNYQVHSLDGSILSSSPSYDETSLSEESLSVFEWYVVSDDVLFFSRQSSDFITIDRTSEIHLKRTGKTLDLPTMNYMQTALPLKQDLSSLRNFLSRREERPCIWKDCADTQVCHKRPVNECESVNTICKKVVKEVVDNTVLTVARKSYEQKDKVTKLKRYSSSVKTGEHQSVINVKQVSSSLKTGEQSVTNLKQVLSSVKTVEQSVTNLKQVLSSVKTGEQSVTNLKQGSSSLKTGEPQSVTNIKQESSSLKTGEQSVLNLKQVSSYVKTGEQKSSINIKQESSSLKTGEHQSVINLKQGSASLETGELSVTNLKQVSSYVKTGEQSVTNLKKVLSSVKTGEQSATNLKKDSSSVKTGEQKSSINMKHESSSLKTGEHQSAINLKQVLSSVKTGEQSATNLKKDPSSDKASGEASPVSPKNSRDRSAASEEVLKTVKSGSIGSKQYSYGSEIVETVRKNSHQRLRSSEAKSCEGVVRTIECDPEIDSNYGEPDTNFKDVDLSEIKVEKSCETYKFSVESGDQASTSCYNQSDQETQSENSSNKTGSKYANTNGDCSSDKSTFSKYLHSCAECPYMKLTPFEDPKNECLLPNVSADNWAKFLSFISDLYCNIGEGKLCEEEGEGLDKSWGGDSLGDFKGGSSAEDKKSGEVMVHRSCDDKTILGDFKGSNSEVQECDEDKEQIYCNDTSSLGDAKSSNSDFKKNSKIMLQKNCDDLGSLEDFKDSSTKVQKCAKDMKQRYVHDTASLGDTKGSDSNFNKTSKIKLQRNCDDLGSLGDSKGSNSEVQKCAKDMKQRNCYDRASLGDSKGSNSDLKKSSKIRLQGDCDDLGSLKDSKGSNPEIQKCTKDMERRDAKGSNFDFKKSSKIMVQGNSSDGVGTTDSEGSIKEGKRNGEIMVQRDKDRDSLTGSKGRGSESAIKRSSKLKLPRNDRNSLGDEDSFKMKGSSKMKLQKDDRNSLGDEDSFKMKGSSKMKLQKDDRNSLGDEDSFKMKGSSKMKLQKDDRTSLGDEDSFKKDLSHLNATTLSKLKISLPIPQDQFETCLDIALRCLTEGKTIEEIYSCHPHLCSDATHFSAASLENLFGQEGIKQLHICHSHGNESLKYRELPDAHSDTKSSETLEVLLKPSLIYSVDGASSEKIDTKTVGPSISQYNTQFLRSVPRAILHLIEEEKAREVEDKSIESEDVVKYCYLIKNYDQFKHLDHNGEFYKKLRQLARLDDEDTKITSLENYISSQTDPAEMCLFLSDRFRNYIPESISDIDLEDFLTSIHLPNKLTLFSDSITSSIRAWLKDWNHFKSEFIVNLNRCNVIEQFFRPQSKDFPDSLVSKLLSSYGLKIVKMEPADEKLIKILSREHSEHTMNDFIENISPVKHSDFKPVNNEIEENLSRRPSDVFPYCPVTYKEEGRLFTAGSKFTATFKDEVYNFATKTDQEKFFETPENYAVQPMSDYRVPPMRICVLSNLFFEDEKRLTRQIADYFNLKSVSFNREVKRLLLQNTSKQLGLINEDAINMDMFDMGETMFGEDESYMKKINYIRDYLNLKGALSKSDLETLVDHLFTSPIGTVIYGFPHIVEDLNFIVDKKLTPSIIVYIDIEDEKRKRTEYVEAKVRQQQLLNYGSRLRKLMKLDRLKYILWNCSRSKLFNIVLRQLLKQRRDKKFPQKRFNQLFSRKVTTGSLVETGGDDDKQEDIGGEDNKQEKSIGENDKQEKSSGEDTKQEDLVVEKEADAGKVDSDEGLIVRKAPKAGNVLYSRKVDAKNRDEFRAYLLEKKREAADVTEIYNCESQTGVAKLSGEDNNISNNFKRFPSLNSTDKNQLNSPSLFEVEDLNNGSLFEVQDGSLLEEEVLEDDELEDRKQIAFMDLRGVSKEQDRYLPKFESSHYLPADYDAKKEYYLESTSKGSSEWMGMDPTDSICSREITSSINIHPNLPSHKKSRKIGLQYGVHKISEEFLINAYDVFRKRYPPPKSSTRNLKVIDFNENKESLNTYCLNETKNVTVMKELCDSYNIPFIKHTATNSLRKLLESIKYITRWPDVFEKCRTVSHQTARELLNDGHYFFSKFGRWCPVAIFEKRLPILQNYPDERLEKLVHPVIHKKYIYFVHTKASLKKFVSSPLKYIEQDPYLTVFPIKIAVVGCPKSGKTKIIEYLQNLYGLQAVKLDTAVQYVCTKLYWTDLAKKIHTCLKQGNLLSSQLLVSSLEAYLLSPKFVNHGWILEGFPITREDVQLMNKCDIVPQVTICVETNSLWEGKVLNKLHEERGHLENLNDGLKGKWRRNDEDEFMFGKNSTDIGEDIDESLFYQYLQPTNFFKYRILKWRQNKSVYGDLKSAMNESWGNILDISWKTNHLKMVARMLEYIKTCLLAFQNYATNMQQTKPASMFCLNLSRNEFEVHMSVFKEVCPCCWFYSKIYHRCPTVNFRDMTPGLFQYGNYIYWICTEHTEIFLHNPTIFLNQDLVSFKETFPERLSFIGEKTIQEYFNLKFQGKCVTCYVKNLPDVVLRTGLKTYALALKKKCIYLFCQEACLLSMLIKPQDFVAVRFPREFLKSSSGDSTKVLPGISSKVASKNTPEVSSERISKVSSERISKVSSKTTPKISPTSTVCSRPVSSTFCSKPEEDYFENFNIYDVLSNALMRVAKVRPRIFEIDNEISSCTYVALILKAQANKSKIALLNDILASFEMYSQVIHVSCSFIDRLACALNVSDLSDSEGSEVNTQYFFDKLIALLTCSKDRPSIRDE